MDLLRFPSDLSGTSVSDSACIRVDGGEHVAVRGYPWWWNGVRPVGPSLAVAFVLTVDSRRCYYASNIPQLGVSVFTLLASNQPNHLIRDRDAYIKARCRWIWALR